MSSGPTWVTPLKIYLKHVQLWKWRKQLLRLQVSVIWIWKLLWSVNILSVCLSFCSSCCFANTATRDYKDLCSKALLLDASISWRGVEGCVMGYCFNSWKEQIPICNLLPAFNIPLSCIFSNGSDQSVSLNIII